MTDKDTIQKLIKGGLADDTTTMYPRHTLESLLPV